MKIVIVEFGFENDEDAEDFADGLKKGERMQDLPKWDEITDSYVEDV